MVSVYSKVKEKVGILGGSFDPIHCGHLGLALEIMEKGCLDRVCFMPAFQSPHKTGQAPTTGRHRMEMVRLAIKDEPRFESSEIEIKRRKISYTIDTLKSLSSLEPEKEPYLIMGADTFLDIKSWKDYQKVLKLSHILVGTRPGFPLVRGEGKIRELGPGWESVLPESAPTPGVWSFKNLRSQKTITLIEVAPKDVSSSQIRFRIGKKMEVKNMLPPEVEKYIIRNHLYQPEPHPIAE